MSEKGWCAMVHDAEVMESEKGSLTLQRAALQEVGLSPGNMWNVSANARDFVRPEQG